MFDIELMIQGHVISMRRSDSMNYDFLESYEYFDFDQVYPRLYCRLESCVVSEGEDRIKFYTGDYYFPSSMLIYNISDIKLSVEPAGSKLDVLHIKLNDEEHTLYAHK